MRDLQKTGCAALALVFAIIPRTFGDDSEPDVAAAIRAARQLETAFAHVADQVRPSVVGISIYAPAPQGQADRSGGEEERYPGFAVAGSGSGFIVSQDGYILTCKHVLAQRGSGKLAEVIDVELPGDLHTRARIIGVEPTINLAVIKVEIPIEHRAAKIADSDLARVGQWAIALGDPAGAERTFVTGTLAARPEPDCYQEKPTQTYLQASMSIHPESWGGPLVNIDGAVIGLNVPRSQDPQLGPEVTGYPTQFALPINLVMTVYEALKLRESRRVPWLGVSVRHLSSKIRQQMDSAPRTGVYVETVVDAGPASRIGLRPGDVVTKIDGNRLLAVQDYQKWLYLLGIGKTITVEFYRDGETIEKQITIELRPAD